MSRRNDIPVLICGGGPVGLALALDLGWRGVPCLLVEQGDGRQIQPKILSVSIRTMEFCRRWGVAENVKNWGFPEDFPLDNVFVTSLAGYEIARLPQPSLRNIPPLPYSPETGRHCPQTWFDPILRRAAERYEGVTLRHGARLEDLRQDGDGVEATLVNMITGSSDTVRADYLVGCDGYRSTVREALGIDMSGRGVIDKSVNLLLRIPNLSTFHDKGDAGRYVLVGDIGTWATFVAIDGRELWRMTLYGSDALDPYEVDHHVWIRRALGSDVPYELVSTERWTRRAVVAEAYGHGRVFLAGDAVHAMPPNGGFGMNTGIADAVDLGWKLTAVIQGWGGPKLLESYEAERRPAGIRAVAEAMRDYDRLTSAPRFPGIAEATREGAEIRRRLGERLETANKRAWEPVGIHLGYRYDPSPIVLGDGTAAPGDDEMVYVPTARPGSRAPHAYLADGRSTLDLFGHGFTLLRLGREPPDVSALAAAAKALRVPLVVRAVEDPTVARLYACPLVLVRPDGHVAWRGDAVTEAPMQILDTARGVGA